MDLQCPTSRNRVTRFKRLCDMIYTGLDKDKCQRRGDLYKKDGAFFIVTDLKDNNGMRMIFEVDPWTIECVSL